MQNVASRLTFVTGIGVSLSDYSKWTSKFKGTDTEKALTKLFNGRPPVGLTTNELMYCMHLAPRVPGTPRPEVESARQKVKAIFDSGKAEAQGED